jgi:anaerobic selenocysteine-containing dehydrogenase
VVVQDAFLTETARLADVVLPTALWGEKTGTFTNADRTVHLSEKAVDPPGEARTDLQIWVEFARRLDLRDADGQPLVKWSTPEEAFDHFKRLTQGRPCDYNGMSYDKLRTRGPIQWPCNAEHPEGTERQLATARAAKRGLSAAAHHRPDRVPFPYQDQDRPQPQAPGGGPRGVGRAVRAGRRATGDRRRRPCPGGVPARRAPGPGPHHPDPPGRAFVPFHYGYWDRQASGPDGDGRAANELTLRAV